MFKVGDKVRVDPTNKIDWPDSVRLFGRDNWTIVKVRGDYLWLGREGEEWGGWYSDRFELVREPQSPLEADLIAYISKEKAELGL